MLKASGLEVSGCRCYGGSAKAQSDRRRSEVEQRKYNLQHRLEACAVVGQLEARLDLAILEYHRRGSVGAHSEAIPWARDRQSWCATGEKVKGRIRRASPF